MTPDDIASALGTAPTVPPKNDASTECDYSTPTMYNFVTVMTSNIPFPQAFTNAAQSAEATVPVSGLGDAAFTTPSTANGCSIIVRKGEKSLRIDYFVAASDPHCPGVEQLARTALGRT